MSLRWQGVLPLGLALLVLSSPRLAAQEEAAAEETPVTAESEEAGEEAAPRPPSGERFTPTEQLRYDQEVDFPVDI
jgi:hypothetical protein